MLAVVFFLMRAILPKHVPLVIDFIQGYLPNYEATRKTNPRLERESKVHIHVSSTPHIDIPHAQSLSAVFSPKRDMFILNLSIVDNVLFRVGFFVAKREAVPYPAPMTNWHS
jgi:hypothetical protein